MVDRAPSLTMPLQGCGLSPRCGSSLALAQLAPGPTSLAGPGAGQPGLAVTAAGLSSSSSEPPMSA